MLDRRGTRHTRTPADYEIGYRRVQGTRRRMVRRRAPGVRAQAGRQRRRAIRELLERRKQTQPIGEWSCGSVFINPPGEHAARLIETRGLEGISHRRCVGVREARQFHHQSRRRPRRRHRGADPARAAHRRRGARHRARHRSAHRRRSGMRLLKACSEPRRAQRTPQEFGKVAVLLGRRFQRAGDLAAERQCGAGGAQAPRRRCACVRSGRAARCRSW